MWLINNVPKWKWIRVLSYWLRDSDVPVPELPVPDGKIIESTSALQCCCPCCEYGKGYCHNFLPTWYDHKIVTCPVTGLKFKACVTEGL